MKRNYKSIKKCRLCNSVNFTEILDLGIQPLSCIFPKSKSVIVPKSPLNLIKCSNSDCGLIQLRHSTNISMMYGMNYGYHSSISPLMVSHLKNKSINFLNRFNVKNKNILDIGCNDGTFLKFFKKSTKNLYGIDPSSKKFINLIDKQIKVCFDFFSKKNIEKKFGNKKFALISSIAMFYDIEKPRSFCEDIFDLLEDDGLWLVELAYTPLMFKNLTYDQICHEHVTYWGLNEFKNLAEMTNFKILDVEFNEINGGSFSLILSKKNSKYKSNLDKITKILKEEKIFKTNKPYKNFKKRITNHKFKLLSFLKTKKKLKEDVYGYGASTKGNIVLNYLGIDHKLVKKIADQQDSKKGLYTPGAKIKIISKSELRNIKPKFILVLIWPFRNEVLKDEKKLIEQGTNFIFSLPRFHIISKKNKKKFINKKLSKMGYTL